MSGLYPRRFRCSSSRGDCVQVLFIRLSPEGCGGRSCLTSFSLSWRRLPLLPVSLRHLSSAGVCLCVHTSHFHKDVGRIEEDPILQTLLNLITFVKILAQKKKKTFVFWSQDSKLSFLGGGGVTIPSTCQRIFQGWCVFAWRFSYVESMWVSVVGALLTFCGCLVLVK